MKAEAINRRLGTDYTQEEVFWAGDTIQQMIEGTLSRYRVEIQTEKAEK